MADETTSTDETTSDTSISAEFTEETLDIDEETIVYVPVEDPLKGNTLEVKDISTARYAMKVASDSYFAIIAMREQMERELKRSRAEMAVQKLELVRPYIPEEVDGNGRPIPLKKMPNPLPDTVPQSVIGALTLLDNQLQIEVERAEAELNESAVPLQKTSQDMIDKVKPWLKQQIQAGAAWLGGKSYIVMSGCTIDYIGNDRWKLVFKELET